MTAPGINATSVKVGIPYSSNGAAAMAALGGNGNGVAPPANQTYDAIINDANAHGGLFGRKIVPVYFPIDVTGDQPTQYEAACTAFTQDNRVYAALGIGSDNYYQCLSRAGVLIVSYALSEAQMRSMPSYVASFDIAVDRLALRYTQGLDELKYFSAWDANLGKAAPGSSSTVGLLTYDSGPYREAAFKFLIPALERRLGAKVIVQQVPKVYTASELGGLTSASANAVIKFRSANVDHVVFFTDSGLPADYVLNYAQSQKYYPRYGFTTGESIQSDIESGLISTPAQQLAGAVGIGWNPPYDVGFGTDGFIKKGPAKRCLDVASRAGIPASSAGAAESTAMACDSIWILQQVAAHATSIAARSWLTALASLGTGYDSPVTQSTYFDATHRDGAASFQPMAFSGGCTCVIYVGTAKAFP